VLRIADVTARYIDPVSEELVSAYEAERENWLGNLSVARAGRVRALLAGERVDVDGSETILRYRLRQHHAGVVCWADKAKGDAGALVRMEQATVELARSAGCAGRPLFLPQDELSAWAWLPLGGQDALPVPQAGQPPPPDEAGIRFALGAAGAAAGPDVRLD
jgi:hypothetical protein